MDIRLILEGKATLEDLERLHALGYEFVLENGGVSDVLQNGQSIAGLL